MLTNCLMISAWRRIVNLLAPRACVVCNTRLEPHENVVCAPCNLHLPRTNYALEPYENALAQLFWGRVKVEKCVALLHYQAAAPVSALFYKLKYGNMPYLGVELGWLMGKELMPTGFFQDVDFIVPVPLSKQRVRQRGYNQSEMLAQGVALATGLKVENKLIRRIVNTETQTHKDRWERADNVNSAFKLMKQPPKAGTHVLFVDDVATTGATLCACIRCLQNAKNIKVSVLCMGVAHAR